MTLLAEAPNRRLGAVRTPHKLEAKVGEWRVTNMLRWMLNCRAAHRATEHMSAAAPNTAAAHCSYPSPSPPVTTVINTDSRTAISSNTLLSFSALIFSSSPLWSVTLHLQHRLQSLPQQFQLHLINQIMTPHSSGCWLLK